MHRRKRMNIACSCLHPRDSYPIVPVRFLADLFTFRRHRFDIEAKDMGTVKRFFNVFFADLSVFRGVFVH